MGDNVHSPPIKACLIAVSEAVISHRRATVGQGVRRLALSLIACVQRRCSLSPIAKGRTPHECFMSAAPVGSTFSLSVPSNTRCSMPRTADSARCCGGLQFAGLAGLCGEPTGERYLASQH